MAQKRGKQRRAVAEGGSSHDFVPLGADDLLDVHAREGYSMKIGYQKFMSPPKRTTQKSNEHWKVAITWGPLDDPDFALDLDGTLYDEAIDTPVMQNTVPPVTEVGTKKEKSKTSVSLLGLCLILISFLCLLITEASSCRLERKSSRNLLE